MDTTQMHTLIELAKHSSMNEAAADIHLTQSAITYQLRTIERELGFSVFNRNYKGINPTPVGKAFLDDLGKILANYDAALASARKAAGVTPSRKIRIAMSTSCRTMSRFVKEACESRFPDASFELVPCSDADMAAGLLNNLLDICPYTDAVLQGPLSQKLGFTEMGAEQSICIFSKDSSLAGAAKLSIDDMEGRALLLLPPGISRASDDIRAYIASKKLDIEIREYTQQEFVYLQLETSDAIALDSVMTAAALPENLAYALLDWPDEHIGFAYRKKDLPGLQDILDYLYKYLKPINEKP